jgi:threonyl-tRNA synthetase
LKNSGIRAFADLRNEKIGFKIREHTLKRIPYMLVIGDKEVEAEKIAVRTRKGDDLGTLTIDEFISRMTEEVAKRNI